jgi:ribonuclease III
MDESISKRLSYKFNRTDLFLEAITHGSWVNENNHGARDYNRLEFLGDSILKLIQGTLFHESFPEWDEGKLTQIRSAHENNKNLSQWAKYLGLDQLILHGKNINKGSAAWEQICAQVFEATLGAIWIDCGYNFDVIYKIYKTWNLHNLTTIILANPKKDLQEYVQSIKLKLPNYTVIDRTGSDHMPSFTVSCVVNALNLKTIGVSNSIKNAEKKAAEEMVKLIKVN